LKAAPALRRTVIRPPDTRPIQSIEDLLERAEQILRLPPAGTKNPSDQAWVLIEQQQSSARLLSALRRFRFRAGEREKVSAALQRLARESAAAWPATLARVPLSVRRDFASIHDAYPAVGLNLRHPGVIGVLGVLVLLSVFLKVSLLISGIINLLGVVLCFVLTERANRRALAAAARLGGEYHPVWRFQRRRAQVDPLERAS